MCLFIISRRAVKNAPSVIWSHGSHLSCDCFTAVRGCSTNCGIFFPHPHEVKCTMEMWCLSTSVSPSFEFSSVFLLSTCILIAPHASSAREGNEDLNCSLRLQQAWEQIGLLEPLEPINKQPQSLQTNDSWCCFLKATCGFRPSSAHLSLVNPTILPKVLCQFTYKSQRNVNSVSLLHRFCPVPITAPAEGSMKRSDRVGRHDRSSLLTARGAEVKSPALCNSQVGKRWCYYAGKLKWILFLLIWWFVCFNSMLVTATQFLKVSNAWHYFMYWHYIFLPLH